MPNKIYTNVVKAYEQNYQMLEIARGEYLRMVETVMSRLSANFQNTITDTLSINHWRIKSEGKSVFGSIIKVNDVEWCKVLARMAAPWSDDGKSVGKMHIALEYIPQADYIPVDRKSVFKLGNSLPGWTKNILAGLTEFSETEKWLVVNVIDLNKDNLLEVLVDSYSKTIELAFTFAKTCHERAQLVIKGNKAMTMAIASVVDNPVCPEQTTEPESPDGDFGEWEGMNYAQVNFNDDNEISLWFCVNPITRVLMYFHDDERDGLNSKLLQILKAEPRKLSECYGGQLFTEGQLSSLSVEKIRDRIVETAKIFYETVVLSKEGK